jgi:hypothetical protein
MWVADHAPCTVSEYMVEVSKLMPRHIARFRSYSDPQMSLAIQALRQLKVKRVSIVDGVISMNAKPSAKRLYDHDGWLQGRSVVNIGEIEHKKQRYALRQYLIARGWKKIARNTYQRPE